MLACELVGFRVCAALGMHCGKPGGQVRTCWRMNSAAAGPDMEAMDMSTLMGDPEPLGAVTVILMMGTLRDGKHMGGRCEKRACHVCIPRIGRGLEARGVQ